MNATSKEIRKSREQIKKEFEECKKVGKLDLLTLKNFMSHCNIIPEIIESYLNILEKEDKNSFFDELIFYYPILSVEVCKKFGVNKSMTEEERFFKLIENLNDIADTNVLVDFLEKEINCYDEIKEIIPKEELDKINENKDLEPFKYSRWIINYNTPIDYQNEDNEEFLFYHLSNNLISEFLKHQKCFLKRISLIKYALSLFEKVFIKRKDGQNFREYFEFLCLAITNCEVDTIGKLKIIMKSIKKEMKNTYMNFDEIKEYLEEKKYYFNCENQKITIFHKGHKFIIDDFNRYNLNKDVIDLIIEKGRFGYKYVLDNNIKFSEHMNKRNDINNTKSLLIKIFKKVSKSNLIFTSIEKLFNIEKEEYEELFNELSYNIEKYIYFLPYNCFYDTERTFKNPIKVLIDPDKEKYYLNANTINNNIQLESILKEFCNIAYRKYGFEHELHHLTTALLYFLYVNEDIKLNSLIKELTPEGEIRILDNFTAQDLMNNTNEKIQKEAGNIFEVLCYGKVTRKFTLKQLLFIVNEDNDNLDYNSFKNNYEEHCKRDLKVILENFPENQLLSEYVKKIRDLINSSNKQTLLRNILENTFIVSKDENDDNRNFYEILNDDNTALVTEFERYDNHLIFEKKPTYKKNKK